MNFPKCDIKVPVGGAEYPFFGAETKNGNPKQVQRIFISSEDTADFGCPQCDRFRTMDVSKYKKNEKTVRLKYKCQCGHSYSVILERRNGGRRKETELFGDYMCIRSGKSVHTGRVVVKDVSITGIRFQLSNADADLIKDSLAASTDIEAEKNGSTSSPLNVGDEIITEFRLDDKKRTLIKHKAVVCWISGRYVGVQFTSKKTHPALGFYMWS